MKPAYSLAYAILIIVGILAVAAYNRLLGSDEGGAANVQRTEAAAAAAREAAKEAAEGAEKPAPDERAESPAGSEQAATTVVREKPGP